MTKFFWSREGLKVRCFESTCESPTCSGRGEAVGATGLQQQSNSPPARSTSGTPSTAMRG